MNYYIGLDIGTSSVKAVLVDENENVLSTATENHNYYFENSLKLFDADGFCEGCFKAVKRAAANCPKDGNIRAICSSGASGNLMLCKGGKDRVQCIA